MTPPANARRRKTMLILGAILLLGLLFIVGANWYIEASTQPSIYNDINEVPANEAAVVLGTAPDLLS